MLAVQLKDTVLEELPVTAKLVGTDGISVSGIVIVVVPFTVVLLGDEFTAASYATT